MGLNGGGLRLPGGLGWRLHVPQPVARRPRRLERKADGVQAILVEQELAPVRGGEIERLHHDDRVGRTDLHAELAELAGVKLEREALRVVPSLRLEHLDLDDLRRADVLAQPAADAVLLAALLVVGQRQHAAEAIRVRAHDVGVLDRDRPAQEIAQRRPHRPAHGPGQRSQLAPEAAVTPHRRLPPPPPGRWRAATGWWRAAAASTRCRGSGRPGSARSSSAPR